MAANNFDKALAAVLKHEGGYVNHPRDPGGATNFGIIQRTYDAHRRRRGLTPRAVKSIVKEEVREIYRTQYWDAIRGDDLPAGIDFVVFDGAVNSGPAQSVKWLQRSLSGYAGRIDGVIGAQTLAALDAHANHDQVVSLATGRRLAFMQALRTWDAFGKGWSRRVAQVRATGHAWAMGDVGPVIHYVPGGERKATIDEAKAPPAKAPADVATGGGVATGGAGASLDQARDTLAPLAGSSSWIDSVIAALVITGVVLAIGGIAWRVYASWRAKKRADVLDLHELPAERDFAQEAVAA